LVLLNRIPRLQINKPIASQGKNCTSVIRKAKANFVQRVAAKLVRCPAANKSFWTLAKRVGSNFCTSSFPPLVNSSGEVVDTPHEKAELFASMFAANSTIDDGGQVPPFFPPPSHQMSSFRFSSRAVRRSLLELDISKATGPDGIPPVVLKHCAPELAPVLCKLFALSVTPGVCPASWRCADVFPVPKRGDRANPSNYRPISITSVLCKVMESCINVSIIRFIESHSLFSDHQYGFRSARSTGDLLAYVTHVWSSILDRGGESLVVSLDISKAFDRVWHSCLIAKLRHAGIDSSLLLWIGSFLHHRSLSVRLDGHSSKLHKINAGVPQGSVLAPTLFLVYINDLLSSTYSDIHSYADDSTLHSSITHRGIGVDRRRTAAAAGMNDDLAAIVSWGNSNLVTFNASKTHFLILSGRRDRGDMPHLHMSNSDIVVDSSIFMLGLTISNNLDWKPHIANISRAAACKLGFLFRARRYFTPLQLLTLYKSQVRPLLDYCSHVWGGAPSSHLFTLDRLQAKALRLVDDPQLTSSLHSLHHRRCVSSLSLFYRYYFSHCSLELSSIIPLPKSYSRNTRLCSVGNPYTVSSDRVRTSHHANSFIPRTSTLWNKLPLSVFPLSYNLDLFKRNINSIDLSAICSC
jgi:hypothetical protein